MPRFVTGVVVSLLDQREGLTRALVRVGAHEHRATVFTGVIGPVGEGDRVVINTTAVDLGLGTGGDDFVLWNLERAEAGAPSGGHILKLRYTPWQIDALVAEAPESPHHQVLAAAESLEGMPVVVCSLHSQAAAVAASLKHINRDLRVTYLMSDGASLPIAHSDLVATLKAVGAIDSTITYGHSFGGDLECVNVFSALVAAKYVGDADVAVVAPGPGVVGTETLLGHSGMEQGQVLSAVEALGGKPVAALRISFRESRERHRVVSHHSLSALRYGALARSVIAVPQLKEELLAHVMAKLEEAGIPKKHEIQVVDASATIPALRAFGLAPTTMGRSLEEDQEFFEAAGAAGIVAHRLLPSQS